MPASLWLDELPPPPPPAPLPPTADVAIVGGGIAGISTALHLAREGLHAVVLEAGEVSCRASGRNDGQLLLGLGEHFHRVHAQFGADKATRLWRFLARNHAALRAEVETAHIDCGLLAAGGLRLAETAHEWQELQQASALLRASDLPHLLLDQAAAAAALPAGRGFFGALQVPGEAVLQPAAMVRGLAAAAAAAGAGIVTGARVTAIGGAAGDFAVQLHDGRTLRAAAVVHCTAALAPELDDSGFLARTVFPFRGQVLATAPLPAALAAQFPPFAMSSNFGYEYFRAHGDRFVIGGMRWSVRGEEQGIVDDDGHNEEVTDNLLGYVARHFPCLHDVAFPHVWTGIMAGTPDGLPLLGGLPGRPGVFALLAFNGYGLSFAFHGGRCLMQMIVDGRCDDEAIDLFAPRRFANA